MKLNRLCAVLLCALLLVVGCVQTAMAADCAHTNYDESSYFSYIELNQGESWKPNADGKTHSAYGKEYREYYCYDCGSYYKVLYKSGLLTWDHYLSDGQCSSCGYGCAHEDVRCYEDSYQLKDGQKWKADSNGTTHSALCVQCDDYYCYDCYYSWKENVVEKTIKEKHWWNNGKCRDCGYVCPHDDLEVRKDYYKLDTGEKWTANSDGKTHSGLCQQYDYYDCNDCDKSWRENEVTKTIKEEHDWRSRGEGERYCYDCGYVCPHEEIELTYRNVRTYLDEGWKDDRNGLTHSRMADVYDQYKCLKCDARLKKNLVTQTITEYHSGTNQCSSCKTYNIVERSSWWINEHPKNVMAEIGDKVTMKVVTKQDSDWNENADKYTLTYEWYYRNAGSTEVKKSSVKKATYSTTMTAAMAGRELYCVITDQYGYKQYSEVATILAPELTIITQPKNKTVSAGETAKFTVKAEGAGLKYQWYYRAPGATKWKEASSTKSSYSIKNSVERNGREFYCKITDAYGKTLSTKTVTMKLPALKISTQPKDTWAYNGEKAKITVKATGDGLTYQWYYSSDGKNWKKASGTSASYSLTMTEARSGRKMYCLVKDAYGAEKKTEVVTLTMRNKLTIAAQPKSAKAYDGEKATATIKATGDGLTYQWYYKNPGSSSYKKSSITTAKCSVAMNADRDGRKMYCIVKDKYGNTTQSDTITLSMKKPVKITTEPKSTTKAVGEKAKFTVKATGDGLKYQWQYKNADSSTWKNASSTSASYSPTVKATHDGRKFRCVITDAYGNKATTKTVKLTVK